VFIPLRRAVAGDAPFLHEAAHEMLLGAPPFRLDEFADSAESARQEAAFPLWLAEGFADYAAQAAADRAGVREGDVFAIGGLRHADSTCAARLDASRRAALLPYIGGAGFPPALFTTERQTVAPAFYACAQSFARHLVERIGVAGVVSLFPEIPRRRVPERVAELAGRPLADLRAEWMARLGVADPPSR
jgi:hypothetical protein